MYQLVKTPMTNEITTVRKENSFIPLDSANTDYQQFKKDVLAGETLERPDGTAMTQAEADAYIATLP